MRIFSEKSSRPQLLPPFVMRMWKNALWKMRMVSTKIKLSFIFSQTAIPN